jgi:hypothetical protein
MLLRRTAVERLPLIVGALYPQEMPKTTAADPVPGVHEVIFKPPPGDYLLRPFEAASFSPVWIGAAIAILIVAASLAGRLLFGEDGGFLDSGGRLRLTNVWSDLLNGAIVGYIPTVMVILRSRMVQDLHALRPSIRCSDAEFQQIVADVTCVPAPRLVAVSMVSGCLFGLMPLLDPTFFEVPLRDLSDPMLLCFIFRSALTGWLAGHAVATEIHTSRAYFALGEARVEVDLLDTRPLYILSRKGIRSALAWIASISLISLFWLGRQAGSANGPIVLGITALVLYSFFYSILGVHRSIRRTKSEQLDTLRDQIRAERGAHLDSQAGHAGDAARLASLIAYLSLVERVPEWPFDTPMALRLVLFVAVGLGSWLGGALVERLLESWF